MSRRPNPVEIFFGVEFESSDCRGDQENGESPEDREMHDPGVEVAFSHELLVSEQTESY